MDNLSPTKLALELLTQLQDELVAYLSALRLLGEEKTVEELETELVPVFGLVADRYEKLSGNVDIAGTNFAQAGRELVLAQSHQETEGNRYESIVALRNGLQESISGLVAQKGSLEAVFAQEIAPIESRIEGIYQDIQTTTVEYNNATDAEIKEGILGTLNGYYVQLQQEQNLLSVRSADYQHDLEVLVV